MNEGDCVLNLFCDEARATSNIDDEFVLTVCPEKIRHRFRAYYWSSVPVTSQILQQD
jgi:hypothetical protein